MYLLGYDVGSSSVKASLLDVSTGKAVASAAAPKKEMEIIARKPGWAEQHPHLWWENLKVATAEIRESAGASPLENVRAIGISYQMHGLVVVDRRQEVLRPSIIWCDSRAVDIGNRAFREIGQERCLTNLLNSPGNFTASKLRWIYENEPEIFERIHKIMLPGDYIAMRLTGEIHTTPSGLSEGILWDFIRGDTARMVLDYFAIPAGLLADVVPTFSDQGRLTASVAGELGLKSGIPVAYRAGDQPNNAFSLNVLEPGEVAATAGTSGVVYGVGDRPSYDPLSRFNTFVHVNYGREAPRFGNLLCLNGTGILYSWLKHNFMTVQDQSLSYEQMNALAGEAPVGSEGLIVLPYGNGAERILENSNPGASFHGLGFNTHSRAHVLRAACEGIVFALSYGVRIMEKAGIPVETVRAGDANMFRSRLFAGAFATVLGAQVELFNTDGSQGAARGAGIGAGIWDYGEAFHGLEKTQVIEPRKKEASAFEDAYGRWLAVQERELRDS
ncbi:MAG TPA: FGGY family carbohydrate kinase [Spirochaetia bacterium]|nr:FGGY family carbohydrate kinase [Spirochaetia bacterium]